MKLARKLLGAALALAMLASLCVPAMAATEEDYWNAYNERWNQGYEAGYAAYGGAGLDALELDLEAAAAAGYTEGFLSGYDSAEWDAAYLQYAYADVNAAITQAGGVPGATNVMMNGACLAFDGVRPENRNGRVMIPMRAICEALGAEVAYDQAARTATITKDGKTVTHVIGTDTMTIQKDGADSTVTMDCASYLKDGTTMVPVRFMAEALECDVSWDGTYKTVVLMDLNALKQTYDAKLTVFNRILKDSSALMEEGKNYSTDERLDVKVTMFDTLNGDKQYGGSLELNGVANRQAANYDVKLDLTDLMEALQERTEPSAEELKMLQLLKVMEFELIYDQENQILYASSPLLKEVFSYSGWVKMSLGDLLGVDMGLLSAQLQDLTMFDFMTLYSGFDGFYAYENLTQMMDAVAAVFGDQNFTKSGSTYTMDMDLEDLMRAVGLSDEEIQQELAYGGIDAFRLQLQVKMTGEDQCDYSLNLQMQDSDLELSAACNKTGMNTDMNLTLHMKNVFEMTMDLKADTKQTSQSVASAPPAGEVVLDLDEMGTDYPQKVLL
ncbi:MAG: copper amine oxidase N-terminal domain-containing protein [Clostridiales bacterium]|nr:copper amine oxidase N-terminal domain-containing protein [Clostridiales bacterium]